MNHSITFRFTTVFLALLSLTLVVFGVLNFQQRSIFQLPDDGVSWVDSAEGVTAWRVAHDSPGQRAGILPGDRLEAINSTAVKKAADGVREIFRNGVWSRVTYSLVRNGQPYETQVVIAPQSSSESLRHYLELVGLAYLVIGTFVLVRRWTAAKSLHFYVFCLTSFVLFTFSYTGKLNLFDWTVYWLNVVALLLQPALFLHFCLSFPETASFLRERRSGLLLLYLPGLVLLLVHVMAATGFLVWSTPLLLTRWYLDRVELAYMAVYLLWGAVWLQRVYRQVEVPRVKQQLKWVSRGTLVAFVPFAALYVVPYFLGFGPTHWMKLSVLTLIFLPLTFGYAIVRYRLMDVDIIFQRGIAYTIATAAVLALSFGLIALFADIFRTTFPDTSRGGWILAIIVTAFLFQPSVNWIQTRLDKLFNPDRYDYRRTLLTFTRDLTSELHRERLLDQVSGRLADTLAVDRLAIFLTTPGNGVRLVKSRGLVARGLLDLGFLNPERPEWQKGYLFFEGVRRAFGFSPTEQATIEHLELHYYLPIKVKDRTLGYLGLGKTRKGDFLSSEDIDLLQTIAGYLAVALENAELYESLEQKANQYQELRDFNEGIIESISVGVIACDLKQTVQSWNSAMERLYGLSSAQAVGTPLAAIFPPDLLAEIPAASEPHRVVHLYKFRLPTPDGRQRIVNISVAPFVGKDARVIGRLLIFNDITERVNLENQLVQAEKLSSIGLLSAGIAHEVNTPLAVISSQAQMILRRMSPDDPLAPTVEKIIKQSFRASEIVNSLLKFSRVSGSEYSELDLNKVIRETVSLVEPMLRASKIALNVQLSPAVPPVLGNYGKLQQVFMNLIMNARDAMPRGGELTLATECENSSIHVEVADNGMGIPPENLSRVFDPFFTTKSKSRGTGLGLAVSYGIIREHSGKIGVESTVGRGTTFRLEFPAARKAVHVS